MGLEGALLVRLIAAMMRTMQRQGYPRLSQMLRDAPTLVQLFSQRTTGLTRQTKGIRPSEMFFLFATVAKRPPHRILESGRARGQSTLVLAHCFPEARIVSIELDRNSNDAEIAAERLKGLSNVECCFGDSRDLLPRMIEPDDLVLIDGPKDFRALKLAFRLIRGGKPRAVFLHDLKLGRPVRRFLDCHVPEAFFSDEPEFVRSYRFLDRSGERPPVIDSSESLPIRSVYGATLGCLPGDLAHCSRLLIRLTLLQWRERLKDSWGKHSFSR